METRSYRVTLEQQAAALLRPPTLLQQVKRLFAAAATPVVQCAASFGYSDEDLAARAKWASARLLADRLMELRRLERHAGSYNKRVAARLEIRRLEAAQTVAPVAPTLRPAISGKVERHVMGLKRATKRSAFGRYIPTAKKGRPTPRQVASGLARRFVVVTEAITERVEATIAAAKQVTQTIGQGIGHVTRRTLLRARREARQVALKSQQAIAAARRAHREAMAKLRAAKAEALRLWQRFQVQVVAALVPSTEKTQRLREVNVHGLPWSAVAPVAAWSSSLTQVVLA